MNGSEAPARVRASLRPVVVLLLGLLAAVATCAACGAAAYEQPAAYERAASTDVTLPPVDGRFDYQIGGAYTPSASVRIVERDRGEQPVVGRYNVCYVNAFQTQPEDRAFWTGRHRDLLLLRGGEPVEDPDWPGEYLLDTSTGAKRDRLIKIVGPWLDGCARDGFQAVEPDNLDSWTRSRGSLSRRANLRFAAMLAERSHARGLAIAQKNASDLGSAGRDEAHLDFAVAEECQAYDECDDYTDVYGRHVIEIEYTDAPRRHYDRACAARGRSISVILRDRDVTTPANARYRYEAC